MAQHYCYIDKKTMHRLLVTGKLMAAQIEMGARCCSQAVDSDQQLTQVWFNTAETVRRAINEHPRRLP